jgi:hypothetical protein
VTPDRLAARAHPPDAHTLTLVVERTPLAVCRLPSDAPVPAWVTAGDALSAVVRTRDELSIIAEQSLVPADARAERGFRALRVAGTLAFELVGVLASIARPLAEARISIVALSTFDTDYVLVRERDLAAARDALARAGHVIEEERR